MNRGATVVGKVQIHPRSRYFFLASCSGIRVAAQVSTATVARRGAGLDRRPASLVRASSSSTPRQGPKTTQRPAMTAALFCPVSFPGAYTLQIERQGFATTQLRGIILNVGDTRDLLIRMKVGPVAESVTVDASGLTLNSTDGAVSTVVDRKLAEAVPLNGQNFPGSDLHDAGHRNPKPAGSRPALRDAGRLQRERAAAGVQLILCGWNLRGFQRRSDLRSLPHREHGLGCRRNCARAPRRAWSL